MKVVSKEYFDTGKNLYKYLGSKSLALKLKASICPARCTDLSFSCVTNIEHCPPKCYALEFSGQVGRSDLNIKDRGEIWTLEAFFIYLFFQSLLDPEIWQK